MRCSVVALASAVTALSLVTSTGSASVPYIWYGVSNQSSGFVSFALPPSHPDNGESALVGIECNFVDGNGSFYIYPSVGDHPEFWETEQIVFEGLVPTTYRNAVLQYIDAYDAQMPTVPFMKGDPLLERLMRGRSLSVHFGRLAGRRPVIGTHLKGTAAVFKRHLAPCL